MGCGAGQCNETCNPLGISIVTPSVEGWSTKGKGAPSLHE